MKQHHKGGKPHHGGQRSSHGAAASSSPAVPQHATSSDGAATAAIDSSPVCRRDTLVPTAVVEGAGSNVEQAADGATAAHAAQDGTRHGHGDDEPGAAGSDGDGLVSADEADAAEEGSYTPALSGASRVALPPAGTPSLQAAAVDDLSPLGMGSTSEAAAPFVPRAAAIPIATGVPEIAIALAAAAAVAHPAAAATEDATTNEACRLNVKALATASMTVIAGAAGRHALPPHALCAMGLHPVGTGALYFASCGEDAGIPLRAAVEFGCARPANNATPARSHAASRRRPREENNGGDAETASSIDVPECWSTEVVAFSCGHVVCASCVAAHFTASAGATIARCAAATGATSTAAAGRNGRSSAPPSPGRANATAGADGSAHTAADLMTAIAAASLPLACPACDFATTSAPTTGAAVTATAHKDENLRGSFRLSVDAATAAATANKESSDVSVFALVRGAVLQQAAIDAGERKLDAARRLAQTATVTWTAVSAAVAQCVRDSVAADASNGASLTPGSRSNAGAISASQQSCGANTGVCGICEEAASSAFCHDCGFGICDGCMADVHSKGRFKRHSVEPLASMEPTVAAVAGRRLAAGNKTTAAVTSAPKLPPKCAAHPSYPAELVCRTCAERACLMCHFAGRHKGHDVAALAEVQDAAAHDVLDAAAAVAVAEDALNAFGAALQDHGRSVHAAVTDAQAACDAVFAHITSEIQRHHGEMTSAISAWGKAAHGVTSRDRDVVRCSAALVESFQAGCVAVEAAIRGGGTGDQFAWIAHRDVAKRREAQLTQLDVVASLAAFARGASPTWASDLVRAVLTTRGGGALIPGGTGVALPAFTVVPDALDRGLRGLLDAHTTQCLLLPPRCSVVAALPPPPPPAAAHALSARSHRERSPQGVSRQSRAARAPERHPDGAAPTSPPGTSASSIRAKHGGASDADPSPATAPPPAVAEHPLARFMSTTSGPLSSTGGAAGGSGGATTVKWMDMVARGAEADAATARPPPRTRQPDGAGASFAADADERAATGATGPAAALGGAGPAAASDGGLTLQALVAMKRGAGAVRGATQAGGSTQFPVGGAAGGVGARAGVAMPGGGVARAGLVMPAPSAAAAVPAAAGARPSAPAQQQPQAPARFTLHL